VCAQDKDKVSVAFAQAAHVFYGIT